jgi:hypothetical protein
MGVESEQSEVKGKRDMQRAFRQTLGTRERHSEKSFRDGGHVVMGKAIIKSCYLQRETSGHPHLCVCLKSVEHYPK